jgi:hypothetical protein
MANELQLLPNPTNIPEAVSTGYQRQNTNVFVLQTGFDTTEPNDDEAGTITIPAGGVVEINGSLFKLTADISLTKPDTNTAYWIAVADNGDGTASLSLVTRPGIYNPAKKGCYTTSGARTLNWSSFGVPDSLTIGLNDFSKNTKGTAKFTLEKGWYYIDLKSGGGKGDGGVSSTIGGGGGVASTYNSVTKTLFIEKPMTVTIKIGGSGYNGGNGGSGAGFGAGGGGGGSGYGEASSVFELGLEAGEVIGGNGGNGLGSLAPSGGGGGIIGGDGGITSASSGGVNGVAGSSVLGGLGLEIYSGGNGGAGGRYNSGSGGAGGSPGRNSNGGIGGNGTGSTSSGMAGGGGGGGMGSHGRWRPDGDPAAGYCNIYKLEN